MRERQRERGEKEREKRRRLINKKGYEKGGSPIRTSLQNTIKIYKSNLETIKNTSS